MDRRVDLNTLSVTFLLLALVLCLTPARASARGGPGAPYTVLSWTESDGLPSSGIWAMAQDADGYIWLGTNEGLVRFDGARFVRWNALGRPTLPERRVMSLLSAADGSLWVGYGGSGGVSRIRNIDEVTSYGRDDGMVEDFVISFTEDREHVIWATSPSGLYRFRGERWERVSADDGVPDGRISAAREDTKGNFWIGTNIGIFRRNSGETTFTQVDRIDSFVSDFTEDERGAIWTTDPIVGFRQVASAGLPQRQSHVARGNGIRVLHDAEGNLWVGTFGQGLWRVRFDLVTKRSVVDPITAGLGLSGNAVRSLLEDGDGNIWVGGDGGLSRLSLSSVAAVRDLGMVRAVVASRDGTVWAGTAGGLIRNPGTDQVREDLHGANVTALHEDKRGQLYAATDRGLFKFLGDTFARLPLPDTIQSQRIMAMTTASDGTLWLTDTGSGVFRLKDGKVTRVDAPSDVGRRTAYGLYADAQDRIWIAFSGGMLAVAELDGTLRLYGPKAGGSLRTVYAGRGGAIWVGGDDGLSRLHAGRFITASRKNGLPGTAVTAVVEDSDGYVWAGVNSGIIRLSPGEFDLLSDDPEYRIRYAMYDRTDGLAGLPQWLGSPTSYRGSDGRVWFVTGEGLTMVDSSVAREGRLAPKARVESVLADEQRVIPRQGAQLPALTQRLQIDFTAPTAISPNKVRFRYWLEGFDHDWIDAGTQRQVGYFDLPPRTYRFRVVASTSDGAWSEAGAVWDFSIKPAFYQTTWFWRAASAALVLGIWAAWRLRIRSVKRQFALVLAERTRVGRELHDTLLQSLVGVALQLEGLSKRADSASLPVGEQLRHMRIQVEDYVREARQSIWDLRSANVERRDLVAALRQAGEHATNGAAVQFEFTVTGTPHPCSPRLEEQLLRIAREAIRNGVLHARASLIRLHLHYQDHAVRLTVADDGLGFDLMQIEDFEGHYGLKSMQERAELAGGHLTIVSSRGNGTAVETIIPTSRESRAS